MSRPTPDRPDGDDEEFLARRVAEAGDPTVAPRPEHVAAVRALIHDRLGPPRARRPLAWESRWLVASGLAAACWLAVLAWPRGGVRGPAPVPPGPRASVETAPRPRPDPAGVAAWRNVRRGLDVSEMPAFSWPLQESSPLTASTSIPPDLLD